MKVSILIPSQDYKSYAGARIRYGRLRAGLLARGVHVQLEDIADFMPQEADCDALIISKCHDARSLVAAMTLSARGRLVGVDLFDDYFSQVTDSRLVRYRDWLSELLDTCHFALCSTPALARVIHSYRGQVPVHVINDPADETADDLKRVLSTKLGEARETGTLRLAWFGVGDNPHFEVGLSDLAAHGAFLSALSRDGMDVELKILTNERALGPENLAKIQRLPVRHDIAVWTEERERDALSEAIACFLPVSSQSFSIAKSLNRAVTALTSGSQVLSAGYPLYTPIDSLIYRDADSFLRDFARGSMRHSVDRFDLYEQAIQQIGDANAESASLADFLLGLGRTIATSRPELVLIHGTIPSATAHVLVQSVGGLSVASPYCPTRLKFDVIFRERRGALEMLVSERVVNRLAADVRRSLGNRERIANRQFWRIGPPLDNGDAEWESASLPFQLATYDWTMRRMSEQLEAAFGPCKTILSENSPYPFERAA